MIAALRTIFLPTLVISFFQDNILADTHDHQTRLQETNAVRNNREFETNNYDFVVKNYYIEHQGNNTLDISVDYTQRTNTIPINQTSNNNIHAQLHQLLLNYPNQTDYWEVLNCYLTKNLLAQNPSLASITITIAVHPNQEFPYYRSTTVTQTNNGERQEFWHFVFHSNGVELAENNLFKINVDYTYRSGHSNLHYPDFIPIYQRIESLLANQFSQKVPWEAMHQKLTATLLRENPMISSISIELERLD